MLKYKPKERLSILDKFLRAISQVDRQTTLEEFDEDA